MTKTDPVLRIGAVGAGRMGRIHIENMLETRFVEVVSLVTVMESEKKWMKELVPEAKVFDNYDEFISDPNIDAVVISSPSGFHKEHVFKAMEHGKHVFCEKPLTENPETAWEVYNKSLEYPHLKICCAFPRRYCQEYVEAAKAIREGRLGTITTLRSQCTDKYDPSEYFVNYIKTSGGIFVDSSIHDIDICLFLLGQDKKAGQAFATGTTNVFPQFAEFGDVDDGMGVVTLDGDLVMNVYGCRNNAHGHHTMTEVRGSKGRLLVNPEPRLLNLEISSNLGTNYAAAKDHMELFSAAYKAELVGFRDWILFDKEHNFNLKDAAKAVTIGHALQTSLRKNSPIKFNT